MISDPLSCRRGASAIGSALLAAELLGALMLWAPIPFAWMWIGGFVYRATGSLTADLAVALFGFIGTTIAMMSLLNRIDRAWISVRRRAGHEQREGALTRIVVASAAIGIGVFYVWFYASGAVVIPFMPLN